MAASVKTSNRRAADVHFTSCETLGIKYYIPPEKTYYDNILFLMCGTRVITEICTHPPPPVQYIIRLSGAAG